jgi:hypothetical protein
MKKLKVLLEIIIASFMTGGMIWATSTFPTTLDSLPTVSSGDTITSAAWNNIVDAINKIEIKLGVDSSASNTSIDYNIYNSLGYINKNYLATGTAASTYLSLSYLTTNYYDSNTISTNYLSTGTAATTYLATGTAEATYFTIAGANASNTAWATDNNTTYTAGNYLTLAGTVFHLDSEIATNTYKWSFQNATVTTDNSKAVYITPGKNITITEVGGITDGTSMVMDCGVAAESSLATSTQICSLTMDADSASNTSFTDATVGAREKIKCKIVSVTAATSSWPYILYSIDD